MAQSGKNELLAIVHSFHSQVYSTLAELDNMPDVIVALDSHLDIRLPNKESLDLLPAKFRLIALRVSAHTMIRRVCGDFPMSLQARGMSTEHIPEMIIAVSQGMINTEVLEFIEEELRKLHDVSSFGLGDFENEFKNLENRFQTVLSDSFGMKLYPSPPKNLLKLVGTLRRTENSLLDLDVDYLYELQTECYSPLQETRPDQLGQMSRVLKLVRKARPRLITISEAKAASINNPRSNFSRFINALRDLGYRIEYAEIFDDDARVEHLLRAYHIFVNQVVKPLGKNYSFEKLREKTKEFFANM